MRLRAREARIHRRLPARVLLRSLRVLVRTKILRRPSLKYMDVALDYACNMRCRHCFAQSMRAPERRTLSIDDHRRIGREALRLGVLHVNLQGGEPTLDRALAEHVRAYHPDRVWVSITTNGFLVDAAMAAQLRRMGVRQLVFSLDGMNPEVHDGFRRTPGAHERILRAIGFARDAGLGLSVNVTVSRGGFECDDTAALFAWLVENRIPYNPIIACPVGAWAGRYDAMVTPEQVERLERQVREDGLGQRDLHASWVRRGCGAAAEQVYLTPYGDVLPCPFIQISFGDAGVEPLETIWRRAIREGRFGRYAQRCWMGENRAFAEAMHRLADGRSLPVSIKDPAARELLDVFWK